MTTNGQDKNIKCISILVACVDAASRGAVKNIVAGNTGFKQDILNETGCTDRLAKPIRTSQSVIIF